MNRQILLPEKARQQLRADFEIERHAFNNYLCFRTNSPTAKMIRKAAIERGALLYTGFKPEILEGFLTVTHNTSPNANCTTYRIGEYAKVLIKHSTNSVRLYVGNTAPIIFSNMTAVSWFKILYCLQLICLNANSK